MVGSVPGRPSSERRVEFSSDSSVIAGKHQTVPVAPEHGNLFEISLGNVRSEAKISGALSPIPSKSLCGEDSAERRGKEAPFAKRCDAI